MRPDERPLAQIKHKRNTGADILSYLHADHLNTPRLATDATQTIVWRWAGDAFGATPPDDDPDADGIAVTVNLRFPGQYFDRETGLHYNWNRYYDPKTGRYITSDPIGLDGGLNTYLYAKANPLIKFDPNGRDVYPAPGDEDQGPEKCIAFDKKCFDDCTFIIDVMNNACQPGDDLLCKSGDKSACARCTGSAIDAAILAFCAFKCTSIRQGCECGRN